MKYAARASLLVALGLAQIGEFSFVLSGLGLQLEVMSRETYNLILAAAIVSIALNPLLLRAVPEAPPVKTPKAAAEGAASA